MAEWMKSLSYREAIEFFTARFDVLATRDRVDTGQLPQNLDAVNGYLFAICSAPGVLSPSEWLPELLPLFADSDAETKATVTALISYAQHLKKRQHDQKYSLPEASDVLSAMQLGASYNSFSQGFDAGYQRIEPIWRNKLPDELKQELESQIFALGFFANTQKAADFLAAKQTSMRPEQLAEQVFQNFTKAADLHVRLGMALAIPAQKKH